MEVPTPGGHNCCEGVCTSSRARQAGAGGRGRNRATPGFHGHWLGGHAGGRGRMRPGETGRGGEEEPGAGDGAEESGGQCGAGHVRGLEQGARCASRLPAPLRT